MAGLVGATLARVKTKQDLPRLTLVANQPTAGYTPATAGATATPGPLSWRPGDTPLSAPLSGGKRPIARMPRLWSTQKCSASAGSTTLGVRYRKTTLAFEATCRMAGRGVQSAA